MNRNCNCGMHRMDPMRVYEEFVYKCLEDPSCTLTQPYDTSKILIYMMGEFGELINSHKHLEAPPRIAEEVGDVLWYLVAFCAASDLSFTDIVQDNMEKLSERYGIDCEC